MQLWIICKLRAQKNINIFIFFQRNSNSPHHNLVQRRDLDAFNYTALVRANTEAWQILLTFGVVYMFTSNIHQCEHPSQGFQ